MSKAFLLCACLLLNIVALTTIRAVSLATDVPEAGKTAPEFKLTSNEGKTVDLKAYRGKWVVLYFYPKDFSTGCTIQARNFQLDLAKYEQMKAVILGVSVDSAESHKEFCAKEGLNFKLLADTDGRVSGIYGSTIERDGKKYSARNTFIIDPKGKIAKVFTGVKPTGHSGEILATLAELQNAKAKAKSE